MDIVYQRAGRAGSVSGRISSKVLSHERYGREQIERTNKELLHEDAPLRQKKAQNTASPDELKKLAAIEARLAAIEAVFPKPKEEKGKEETKK